MVILFKIIYSIVYSGDTFLFTKDFQNIRTSGPFSSPTKDNRNGIITLPIPNPLFSAKSCMVCFNVSATKSVASNEAANSPKIADVSSFQAFLRPFHHMK